MQEDKDKHIQIKMFREEWMSFEGANELLPSYFRALCSSGCNSPFLSLASGLTNTEIPFYHTLTFSTC